MAYISRLNLLRKTIEENPGKIIISERSLSTDKYVFAQMLYDSKNMEHIEFEIYNKWFYHFFFDIIQKFIINLNKSFSIYIKIT